MKTIKINGEVFQLVEKRDKEALAERVTASQGLLYS